MNLDLKYLSYRNWLALSLALVLVLGALTVNLHLTQPNSGESTLTRILPDDAAQISTGTGPGTCGIAVGIAAGVVGLALAGVTVGFGTALIISAGFHVAGSLCALTKA
jgi:hypothetical protein